MFKYLLLISFFFPVGVFASTLNNTATCNSSGFTGLADFSQDCTGTQDFPNNTSQIQYKTVGTQYNGNMSSAFWQTFSSLDVPLDFGAYCPDSIGPCDVTVVEFDSYTPVSEQGALLLCNGSVVYPTYNATDYPVWVGLPDDVQYQDFQYYIQGHCRSNQLSLASYSGDSVGTGALEILPYDTRVVATSSVVLGATSTLPLYIQDSGNISVELAILIVMGFLMVIAFFYNSMTSKKPWL